MCAMRVKGEDTHYCTHYCITLLEDSILQAQILLSWACSLEIWAQKTSLKRKGRSELKGALEVQSMVG